MPYSRPIRGARCIYHVGHVGFDRSAPNPNWAEVNTVAHLAYSDYTAGHVALVTRRVGENVFEYIAIGLK